MATFTVTVTNDSGPGSLRAAILAASPGDNIVFSTTLNGSTITLLTPLVLNKAITINGSTGPGGQDVVVSGGGTTTVFDVTATGVTLENLGIANGVGVGAAGTSGGSGGDAAGGIFVQSGSLALLTDTFFNDQAFGGAGSQSGSGGSAAGAYYIEPGATVLESGSSFFGNAGTGGAAGPNGGASGVGYPITNFPACFCPGTLILTDRGEVPVEALAIGDHVITRDGSPEPIRWIGRRSYAGRFLKANPAAMPILIRAGSLGGGLPRRDLRVSPTHSMYLDGLLVPAESLVNGITIVVERSCEQVDYVHVELARHDAIFAEGAASETFIDDDSRGIFHNAAEFAALYPDLPPAPQFFARRLDSGLELEAIRARLSGIAGEVARAA